MRVVQLVECDMDQEIFLRQSHVLIHLPNLAFWLLTGLYILKHNTNNIPRAYHRSHQPHIGCSRTG